ncbi:phage terminase large subunit family protein [Clostridium ganghwense]|uniref:DNA packaging protein n=1 Tax=Clostridium ganghwense TaxID=312089 RepID=A0ABT4CUL9_9CLOT|nr:phage terminase large subunit family protein [Clostridium ganghwense]MCY6372756.1 DNA packaging protein [Clostridium ganghwense]
MARMTKEQKLQKIKKDCRLWAKNMTKILNVDNELVPFSFNNEQNEMLEALKENKYICCLKSRQLGISEFSLNYILWNICNIDNITCVVCSYEDTALNLVMEKLKRQFYSIPDKYRLKVTRDNDKLLKLENGSSIVGKIAGNKDILRGTTAQVILFTEYGIWDSETQENGLTALEPALSKNKDSRIIIESTAKHGTTDYFYKLSMNALKGRSKYKLVFFPWYQNKELYKEEYEEAEQWYKSENHGERLHESDLDKYELDLYKKGAILKQLMWRRWKLLDMSLIKFQNEHCAIPEEAFAGNSADNVFDQTIILERLNHINSNNLKHLSYKEVNNMKPLPDILKRYYGKGFYIYKEIKANEVYFAGCDTAMGLGGNRDSQAINILDSSGEQVAVFNRNDIPIYKFAKICYELGHYFNYMMYLVEVNTNGGTGADLVHRLRKEMGYLQVLKTKRFDKITGKSKFTYGWTSTEGTKAKLISNLKEYFEEGLILVNDTETLNELNIYVEKNGKMGNTKGTNNHDDLVISLALAVECMKQNKSYI